MPKLQRPIAVTALKSDLYQPMPPCYHEETILQRSCSVKTSIHEIRRKAPTMMWFLNKVGD